jgi:hypothetical protein
MLVRLAQRQAIALSIMALLFLVLGSVVVWQLVTPRVDALRLTLASLTDANADDAGVLARGKSIGGENERLKRLPGASIASMDQVTLFHAYDRQLARLQARYHLTVDGKVNTQEYEYAQALAGVGVQDAASTVAGSAAGASTARGSMGSTVHPQMLPAFYDALRGTLVDVTFGGDYRDGLAAIQDLSRTSEIAIGVQTFTIVQNSIDPAHPRSFSVHAILWRMLPDVYQAEAARQSRRANGGTNQ